MTDSKPTTMPVPVPGLQKPLAPGEFVKYHALGNDYLVMAAAPGGAAPTPTHVTALCDRHRGIGADGVLVLLPGDAQADAGLQIINPDGSVAEKSGNGLRIFARALFDLGYVQSAHMVLRLSPTGELVHAELIAHADAPHRVAEISVGMGQAQLTSDSVAMTGPKRSTLHELIELPDLNLDATCVSMGNPHCVIFVDALDTQFMRTLGPRLENLALFTRRTNVQFACVRGRADIDILIWERGAGETQASGSSSSAVAVAAYCRGLCERDIRVHSPGGTLAVAIGEALTVNLRGAAEPICRGTWIQGEVSARPA